MHSAQEEKHIKTAHIASQHKMRFYQNQFPAQGQLVMGQSQKSEENGCYVALLEYNRQKGMMPINEYTTTMKKAIHRAMKEGKKEVLRVIRVDKEKGYIDLSKKQVNADDEVEGQLKYTQSTLLHSILIHVAQATKTPILTLYQSWIWPLYKNQKGQHPLSQLKHAMASQEKLNELNITDEKFKKSIMDQLKRRFPKPIVKTMANFSVWIRTFAGINAIKRALHAGIEASKEKGYDVKVVIIGAPKYTCEVSSTTVQAGKQAILVTLAAIQASVKSEGGDYSTDKQPYIVGDTNAHIKEMIKEEEGQKVVDGDDSDMGDADDDL